MTHSRSVRQAVAVCALTEYMRALAISIAACLRPDNLGVSQPLADAQLLRLGEHRGAERDVRQRQAPVPEEIRLVVVLAARLQTGDDLAELGMERGFRKLARFDMREQAAEASRLALSP